jgi:hypothetical protein
MVGVLTLYYRSFETALTLLRMDSISAKQCLLNYGMIIILKHILYPYCIIDKLSSHNVACAL